MLSCWYSREEFIMLCACSMSRRQHGRPVGSVLCGSATWHANGDMNVHAYKGAEVACPRCKSPRRCVEVQFSSVFSRVASIQKGGTRFVRQSVAEPWRVPLCATLNAAYALRPCAFAARRPRARPRLLRRPRRRDLLGIDDPELIPSSLIYRRR